jgi:tetratricopeptide (TPR) repeat protein
MLKTFSHIFAAAFIMTAPMASAQVVTPPDEQDLPPPEPILPELLEPQIETTPEEFSDKPVIEKPDYSRLSAEEERAARLDALFIRLADADDDEQAELIAEEIWAIWLDSGSASINFILRRGTAAQGRGDIKLARRMFDQTVTLQPDYAEGWARSARLALQEKDLSRALTEAATTLTLEPRHFYALWTMGNVFEQLGRSEEALEAYREANKLHPQLKAVKERLDALESTINGDVL